MTRPIDRLQQDVSAFKPVGDQWTRDLSRLYKDLFKCGKEPKYLDKYRKDVDSREPDNSLVVARDNLQGSSPKIPRGLEGDLQLPLDKAETWLQSAGVASEKGRLKDVAKAWHELQKDFRQNVQGRFPFGDPRAANPMAADAIVRFFGESGGSLKTFRKESSGCTLPPAITKWLRDAEGVSSALFIKDTDNLKLVTVTLTVQEPYVAGAGDAEGLTVDGIHVNVAGQPYSWTQANVGAGTMTFDMFGPALNAPSSISVTLTGSKSAVKAFYGDAKALMDQSRRSGQISNVAGPWSMLSLLQPNDADASAMKSVQDLQKNGVVSGSGNQHASVHFKLNVDARALVPYYRLREDGLAMVPDIAIDPDTLSCTDD